MCKAQANPLIDEDNILSLDAVMAALQKIARRGPSDEMASPDPRNLNRFARVVTIHNAM
jgi:hypothetical protein